MELQQKLPFDMGCWGTVGLGIESVLLPLKFKTTESTYDFSVIRIIESFDQADDRGFPTSRHSNQCQCLARKYVEVQALQHPDIWPSRVDKVNTFEHYMSLQFL